MESRKSFLKIRDRSRLKSGAVVYSSTNAERQAIYMPCKFWEDNKQISALLFIHIDGASRGNPGGSGIGIVLVRDSHTVTEYREFIGTKTNNQAEYLALKKALEVASSLDSEVTILSDSELLINQRLHYYKVRNKQLKELFRQISSLERRFKTVNYRHVPRELNKHADLLANQAIDERIKYKNGDR